MASGITTSKVSYDISKVHRIWCFNITLSCSVF